MDEKWSVNLACDSDFHVNHRVIYTPQICDTRQTALLPLQRKACCGSFCPQNLTALAVFEPAILGTRGRHANPKTTEAATRGCSAVPLHRHPKEIYKSHFNSLKYLQQEIISETKRFYLKQWSVNLPQLATQA
jgi:hypothetical protein